MLPSPKNQSEMLKGEKAYLCASEVSRSTEVPRSADKY